MGVDVATELINNYAFPIVMVGYFIWDKYKTMHELIKAIENSAKTIDNNTNLLTRLLERFDRLESVIENE